MKNNIDIVRDSLTQVGTEKAFQNILDARDIEPNRRAVTITENGVMAINPATGFEGIPGADITVNVPTGEQIINITINIDANEETPQISLNSYPQEWDTRAVENEYLVHSEFTALTGTDTIHAYLHFNITGTHASEYTDFFFDGYSNFCHYSLKALNEGQYELVEEEQYFPIFAIFPTTIKREKQDGVWGNWEIEGM